jgi:hypothetical protein
VNNELRVTIALEVIKKGRGNVSESLYKSAERVLEDFLNPKTCDDSTRSGF